MPPPDSLARIQMRDVVTMARMVPVGIDFCASLRSPERLDPAMIPVGNTDRRRPSKASERVAP